MKHSKLWLTLILIASGLLVSAAKNVNVTSPNPRRDQHERATAEETQQTEQRQQEPSIPQSVVRTIQSQLSDALHAIRAQAEAGAENNRAQKDRWDKASVVASYLLFIVGCLYTYFAWGQWGEISRQATIANRELEIANRAYLYLSGVTIRFYEPENVYDDTTQHNYDIIYPIFNGGQTPALYIGAFARAIVSNTPPREVSPAALVLDRPQSAVIAPRSHEPVNGKYRSFVGKEELDDLRGGKRKLFFYGRLTYVDIFKKERHTCFTLSFVGTPAKAGKNRPMAVESGEGLNGFD